MDIRFDRPAQKWTEALPIGNGRLGGMIFGDIGKELIQLNEDTLWSGGPSNTNRPEAREALTRARDFIASRNYSDAEQCCKEMLGPYTQSYLPFGDLVIQFTHGNHGQEYQRHLDLNTGISHVEYKVGKVLYKREMLASYPDQIITICLTASLPGMISFSACLSSPLRFQTQVKDNQFVLQGRAPQHVDPNYYDTDEPVKYGSDESSSGMKFEGRLAASYSDGTLMVDHDGRS